MKVLVVAAHPDDEILGCGGTLARLSGEGHEVYIAVMGEGITSRFQKREQADVTLIQALHAKCREVAHLIGAKDVFLFNFPDNRFDTVPLLDIVKVLEDVIERIRPEVIYTHHAGDLNIDHVLVHRAVLTATRPVKNHPVREIYAFEVPSSTEWSFQRSEPVFRPNYFKDISGTLQIKLQALSKYDTEAHAFPHPRSPEAIRATAQRWGSVVGCDAVEAFELIRAISVRGGDE